jgi:DNA transposition AAA+ family ATPase
MSDITTEGTAPGPEDESEKVRAEVRRIMAAENASGAALARESAIAPATFSAWLNNTYQGRVDAVTAKVQIWLDSRKVQQRTRAAAPKVPGFVPTDSSESIRSILEYAQHTPDLVVIDGGPGVGKTMTCTEYQRTSPAVWMTTAEPAWSTPRMLLEAVAQCMSIPERYSAQRISNAIVQRQKGSGGLLIVDEAQHLSSAAIDQLRTFHDLAGIGIALVGNATVYSRLEGEGRKPQFAQLYSRIGRRLSRPKPYKNDVDVLLDAWGVQTAPERKMLHMIAKLPGALREMTKTLRQAFICAAAAGRTAITCDDIRSAGEQRGMGKIMAEAA